MNSPQKETIKAGGIKTITSLPYIYAIVLMGLFTFVFLSVEYMFVSRLSLLVSQQRIMYLESVQQVFYYILCLSIF